MSGVMYCGSSSLYSRPGRGSRPRMIRTAAATLAGIEESLNFEIVDPQATSSFTPSGYGYRGAIDPTIAAKYLMEQLVTDQVQLIIDTYGAEGEEIISYPHWMMEGIADQLAHLPATLLPGQLIDQFQRHPAMIGFGGLVTVFGRTQRFQVRAGDPFQVGNNHA